MNSAATSESPLWYAVYTKPREEERAESNLRAGGVKTLMPKFKELEYGRSSGRPRAAVKNLFPRYLFAQFNCEALLHKVNYTRGVCGVVSFGLKPCPIDDFIIETIQSQIGEGGLVNIEALYPGDRVKLENGPFKGLEGTVHRATSDRDRVVVLLSSVSYQGRLMIERAFLKKLAFNH
ncbi:MAG TPA: transcription termination/antitermination NusG family protein [Pyrinomonadaceae bacterium]|nr:transcription termination/antitermination NusG family protein [Pyrinomonadaceae bacterium]